MVLLTAPYNNAMRLGCGFNSFTQNLCVNDAVVKEDQKSATEADLRQEYNPDETSQIVSYSSRFVDHASEVMDAMNISGSVHIKLPGLGEGGGSASYLNTNSMNNSDLNFLIQVKVINQRLVADEVTRFNSIPNLPNNSFTETYGDSFISGFIEGGEFYALLSVEIASHADVMDVKAKIGAKISKPGVDVDGEVQGGMTKKNEWSDTKITISVTWSGGGEIRPESDRGRDWTIDSMKAAANGFAERVARCPQRISAILTKYTALRSFQELTNKGSPLDYENAGVYTNALLDAYMDYKDIWKLLTTMTIDVQNARAIIARGEDDEIRDYAREAQVEYARKAQAYFFPQTKFADLESTPLLGRLQPESNNGFDVVPAKINTGDGKDPNAGTSNVYDMNLELAKVSNRIIEARKQLELIRASELYDPPLRFNALKPYAGSLLGLDRARRDCRWEMIKIVREVDAVTLDPKVAVDTDRSWQYLNPAIFRQLLPVYHPKPPPYTQADMDAAIDARQKEIDTQKAALDAAAADKQGEPGRVKAAIDIAVADRMKEIDALIFSRATEDKAFLQLQEAVGRVEASMTSAQAKMELYSGVTEAEYKPDQNHNSVIDTVKFPAIVAQRFELIYGVAMLDFAPSIWMRFSCSVASASPTGFYMKRRSTITQPWNYQFGVAWMTIPDSICAEVGEFDTYQEQIAVSILDAVPDVSASKYSRSYRSRFKRPFKVSPTVVYWIQGMDWPFAGTNRRLDISIIEADTDGVTLEAFTWIENDLISAKVGWFAYDSGEQRIKSGTCGVGHDGKVDGNPGKEEKITFPTPFPTTPTVFTALKKIDMAGDLAMRLKCSVKDVRPDGFTLRLESFADSVIWGAQCVWIAMI